MASTHPPTDVSDHPPLPQTATADSGPPPSTTPPPADRPGRSAGAGGRRAGLSRPGWPHPVILALVVVLAGLAFAVRFEGLDRRDGDLSTDESRLALVAEEIARTGLPYLPSGRIYTRGLVTAYVMAPSLAAFGPHDWAARLPSVVAGTLLVPAVFLLTRAVAGSGAALVAAAFVVLAEPLVSWSRQAWPPMTFLLFFTLAAYAVFRGFVRDKPRWQWLAALGFLATLLTYELAMLLPLGLGLYLAGRSLRRDFGWWKRHATLDALAIGVVALVVLAVLGLALRIGSLAGADAEFRHYFTPDPSPNGVRYYVKMVWGSALPFLLLVPAGLVWRRVIRRPAPPGLWFLLALLAAAMFVPTYIIQDKQEEQYGLAVVPLLGVLGAWGIAALAGGRRSHRLSLVVTAAVGLIALGVVLQADLPAALRSPTPSRAPTWIDDLRARGWQADDLVLSEAPLVSQFYLGRSDFYLQPEGFERYARQDGPLIRFLYTDAILLRRRGDFEWLVAGRNPGRTLWVIGHDDRLPRLTRQIDPVLWQWLQDASGVARPTRGWWLMRVVLPG